MQTKNIDSYFLLPRTVVRNHGNSTRTNKQNWYSQSQNTVDIVYPITMLDTEDIFGWYQSHEKSLWPATLTFNDAQGPPDGSSPARADQPGRYLGNQLLKTLWVLLHDLIKLRKLEKTQQIDQKLTSQLTIHNA